MYRGAVKKTGTYIVEKNSGKILSFNEDMRIIAPSIAVGKICSDVMMHKCGECGILSGKPPKSKFTSFNDKLGVDVTIHSYPIKWYGDIDAYIFMISFENASPDPMEHVIGFSEFYFQAMNILHVECILVDIENDFYVRRIIDLNGDINSSSGVYSELHSEFTETRVHRSCRTKYYSDFLLSEIKRHMEQGNKYSENYLYKSRHHNMYRWNEFSVLRVVDNSGKAWAMLVREDIHEKRARDIRNEYKSRLLISAVMQTYYMVMFINVTKNTYEIIENTQYQNDDYAVNGVLDDMVDYIEDAIYDDFKVSFRNMFGRQNQLDAYTRGKDELYFETPYRRYEKGNEKSWIAIRSIFMENSSNGDVVQITMTRRIDEKEYLDDAKFASNYDPLTGMYNRMYYRRYCAEFKNQDLMSLGMAVVNMNGLKAINEKYGFDEGDAEICRLAEIVKINFPNALHMRIGDDEFLAVESNCGQDEFMERVSNLRNRLVVNGRNIASCGASWSNKNIIPEVMVETATKLMMMNKQEYYADHGDDVGAFVPRQIHTLMEDIKNRRYVAYLQPQYNVKENRVAGAEALIRYIDDDGKIIPPAAFIEKMENENMIYRIDFFILEEVCALMAKWKRMGIEDMCVSVNMSRATLMLASFIPNIKSIYKQYDFDHENLIFEITERALDVSRSVLNMKMKQIVECGFKISLDDYGSKHSSIDMLIAKEISEVKVDKLLTDRVLDTKRAKTLAGLIVNNCEVLGLRSLIEGVETKEQAALVKELGYDMIQGYYYDKPMPIKDFEKKYIHK